jgi:hypothetical protein
MGTLLPPICHIAGFALFFNILTHRIAFCPSDAPLMPENDISSGTQQIRDQACCRFAIRHTADLRSHAAD